MNALSEKQVAFTVKRFVTTERIGSGATVSDEMPAASWEASERLLELAVYYLGLEYAVEWHDGNTWFVATHESEPTVFCAIREVK